jgi:ADP-glucose pyrophosphorylase
MRRAYVGRRARVRRAIVKQDADVPESSAIGYDLEEDRRRVLVADSPIVVVPANTDAHSESMDKAR